MPDLRHLKDVLHRAGLSSQDKALIILAEDNSAPKTQAQIAAIGKEAGLGRGFTANLSLILRKAKGFIIETPGPKRETSLWELHQTGYDTLAAAGLLNGSGPAAPLLTKLRALVQPNIDANVQAFVNEAIRCIESGLQRAGIVFAWVGARRRNLCVGNQEQEE